MILSGHRARLVVLASLLVGAGILLWPDVIATLQSKSSENRFSVTIDLDDTIVLPKLCKGKLWRPQDYEGRLGLDGRTSITISVEGADGVPLNYDYSVTGGGIYAKGPNGTWDLARSAPSEYKITVTVDDGVGNSGRATRTVQLTEPFGQCPCTCPVIEVTSHYTEVKPDDTVDFEVRTWGGDFDGGPKYHWTVEKGTIISGQGTPVIEVKATGLPSEMVVGHATIGGIDSNCICSQTASESVAIGYETKLKTLPLLIHWLSLDEDTVLIECPPGAAPKRGSKSSEDLVITVQTAASSNSLKDTLSYTYGTTGGKIVGSGARVNWDLTGLPPGTYSISVGIDDGKNVSDVARKSVTLAERECRSDVFCPTIEFSPIRRAKDSNDFILSVFGDFNRETELTWDAEGAEVIAGQGTSLIRLRPLKSYKPGLSKVTLELQHPPDLGICPREFSRKLDSPVPEL